MQDRRGAGVRNHSVREKQEDEEQERNVAPGAESGHAAECDFSEQKTAQAAETLAGGFDQAPNYREVLVDLPAAAA